MSLRSKATLLHQCPVCPAKVNSALYHRFCPHPGGTQAIVQPPNFPSHVLPVAVELKAQTDSLKWLDYSGLVVQ